MPHFVTDISPARRAVAAKRARTVSEQRVHTPSAYRRRLAALRDRAPDLLCARVRRVLREADPTMTHAE